MTYSEKLKDPRWQKKRLQVMDRDCFACKVCEEKTKPLSVHHRYYVSGRMPWEYPLWSLETLCEECHEIRHELEAEPLENEGYPFSEWESAIGFMIDNGRCYDGIFWELAVQIELASREGVGREKIYRTLEKCAQKMRDDHAPV